MENPKLKRLSSSNRLLRFFPDEADNDYRGVRFGKREELRLRVVRRADCVIGRRKRRKFGHRRRRCRVLSVAKQPAANTNHQPARLTNIIQPV